MTRRVIATSRITALRVECSSLIDRTPPLWISWSTRVPARLLFHGGSWMKQFDFRSTPLLLIGRDPDMLTLLREVLMEAGFFVVARLLDGFLLNLNNSEDYPSLILYDEAMPEVDAERVFYLLQDFGSY